METIVLTALAIVAIATVAAWPLMIAWGVLAATFGFPTINLLEAFIIGVAVRGLTS